MDGGKQHFFISYTQADRPAAEWIAWQLEAAGYSVVIQAWHFRPGQDFVQAMDNAAKQADRTLAVLSAAYLQSQFAGAEWRAAFARDPSGERGLLQVTVGDVAVGVVRGDQGTLHFGGKGQAPVVADAGVVEVDSAHASAGGVR